jgi:pyruvate formate lyase activating enzyme
MSSWATPEEVATVAVGKGCRSIAFTYNDPIIFAEYGIDCAREAHERGLKTVAVSNGYMGPEARADYYAHIDAANIDLKAFTPQFYKKLCFAELEPVLDTLRWLHRETDVWLEVTTLLIPGKNDSEDEIRQLGEWFMKNLGPEVPLHLTAFHPDFKMMDVPPTPAQTLRRAREQARAAGLHYVYTGNIVDPAGQTTHCPGCGEPVIGRDGYRITHWSLDDSGRCDACGQGVAGRFDSQPGDWGSRRELVWPGAGR